MVVRIPLSLVKCRLYHGRWGFFLIFHKKCSTKSRKNDKINLQQLKALQDLHCLPCFQNLVGNMKSETAKWQTFLHHTEPETVIPQEMLFEFLGGGGNSRVSCAPSRATQTVL